MNEKINQGGPAFPFVEFDGDGKPVAIETGMTLWDYYAAHAPIDVSDANAAFCRESQRNATAGEMLAKLAELRGVYADAMIKAREAHHG